MVPDEKTKISSSTILIYSPQACMVDTEKTKKISEFVQVSHNGKIVHIRKSISVWLFQECERVSSDHLFKVRMVQPNSLESYLKQKVT